MTIMHNSYSIAKYDNNRSYDIAYSQQIHDYINIRLHDYIDVTSLE
jgi:hypothetical protein